MKTAISRWLPPIATLALLLFALLTPARRVGAGGGPRADALFIPSCDLLLEESGSSATFGFKGPAGVTQPFHFAANVASCSLGLEKLYYAPGTLSIVKWDPATLTPASETVALRSTYFNASEMERSAVAAFFDPPVILREDDAVAEGFGSDLAIQFQGQANDEIAHYAPDGAPDLPVARSFASSPSTPQSPLPGTHPVLDHRLCGGNSTLQELAVVQSVTRCDSVVAGGTLYEAAQRFQIPAATKVDWIEFVAKAGPTAGQFGVLAIYDAVELSEPPVSWPASVASAYVYPNTFASTPVTWETHLDFDHEFALVPNHDYWLVFRTFGNFAVNVRRRTGTEGAGFGRIGPLRIRSTGISPWEPVPNMNLDFRIIGTPYLLTAVGPPAPARAGLQMSVAPTPARGPVAVSWSGARGAVHLEVLDARGRRVATGEAAATTGRWTWNAADAAGRAVPAGIYFVRARDAAHANTQRVVLVR
jgi:hypothetical protein